MGASSWSRSTIVRWGSSASLRLSAERGRRRHRHRHALRGDQREAIDGYSPTAAPASSSARTPTRRPPTIASCRRHRVHVRRRHDRDYQSVTAWTRTSRSIASCAVFRRAISRPRTGRRPCSRSRSRPTTRPGLRKKLARCGSAASWKSQAHILGLSWLLYKKSRGKQMPPHAKSLFMFAFAAMAVTAPAHAQTLKQVATIPIPGTPINQFGKPHHRPGERPWLFRRQGQQGCRRVRHQNRQIRLAHPRLCRRGENRQYLGSEWHRGRQRRRRGLGQRRRQLNHIIDTKPVRRTPSFPRAARRVPTAWPSIRTARPSSSPTRRRPAVPQLISTEPGSQDHRQHSSFGLGRKPGALRLSRAERHVLHGDPGVSHRQDIGPARPDRSQERQALAASRDRALPPAQPFHCHGPDDFHGLQQWSRPSPKPGGDMAIFDIKTGKVEAHSAGLGGNGGSAANLKLGQYYHATTSATIVVVDIKSRKLARTVADLDRKRARSDVNLRPAAFTWRQPPRTVLAAVVSRSLRRIRPPL